MDEEEQGRWSNILGRVPMPAVDEHGYLQEWLEDHEPIDPGHRHRSPFVGLSPGDRITLEDTPAYQEAARKLLEVRLGSRQTIIAFTPVWDAHILARLYEGDRALQELNSIAMTWLIDNLLLSSCGYFSGEVA